MAKIFIETTAQIARLTSRALRNDIEQELLSIDSPEYVSSLYVLMEIKRTLIEDIEYVRGWVLEIDGGKNGLTRLEDICESLAASPGVFSIRRAKRIILVVAHLIRFYKNDISVPANVIGDFLDMWARQCMREASYFIFSKTQNKANITLADDVKCSIVDFENIGQTGKMRLHCNKDHARCIIDQLFGQELEAVDGFLKMNYEGKDPEAVRMLSSFIRGELETLKGQRSCWKVGDMVIAIEAKMAGSEFILSYDKQYLSLCYIFGMKLLPNLVDR